jgi:hypothetical protein
MHKPSFLHLTHKIKDTKLFWMFFSLISAVLLAIFLWLPALNYGGDIVEYHGITESLIKSGGIHLTPEVQDNLSHYLPPAYLQDPQYYIAGRNGERYPVHFVLYSFIALPIRLLLKLFHLNELNTLRITNFLIFTATCAYIIRRFLPTTQKRFVFLFVTYLSPLIWFIIWPGADVFYLCMLLLGIFFFLDKQYLTGIIFTILASWHSQPLLVAAAGMSAYYVFRTIQFELKDDRAYISIVISVCIKALGLAALALVPYAYNFLIFGTLTPWTILQDGWTKINGFGIQNMSLWKFFEQWFDLNVGLFWYAPILFLCAIGLTLAQVRKNRDVLAVFIIMLITAFFYQTNPAWHYGTSGFGPSRHAIFLLPFLIYATTQWLDIKTYKVLFISLFLFTQSYILAFNGGLYPNFLNTLQNSPYATFALDTFPALYNPTPEIFVDRTNHTDLSYPSSAFYKKNDVCKKAYVLITDVGLIKQTCGALPAGYTAKFDDPYSRKANFPRSVKTIYATFWPDPGSCGNNFFPTPEKPYVCMKTITDVLKETGVSDADRFSQVDNLTGVWHLKEGSPVTITIPPGYFIQYYSFQGIYVNF